MISRWLTVFAITSFIIGCSSTHSDGTQQTAAPEKDQESIQPGPESLPVEEESQTDTLPTVTEQETLAETPSKESGKDTQVTSPVVKTEQESTPATIVEEETPKPTCPDTPDKFHLGSDTADLVEICLGGPDYTDKSPDGRFIYFYTQPGGEILVYLFEPDKTLANINAYQEALAQ